MADRHYTGNAEPDQYRLSNDHWSLATGFKDPDCLAFRNHGWVRTWFPMDKVRYHTRPIRDKVRIKIDLPSNSAPPGFIQSLMNIDDHEKARTSYTAKKAFFHVLAR